MYPIEMIHPSLILQPEGSHTEGGNERPEGPEGGWRGWPAWPAWRGEGVHTEGSRPERPEGAHTEGGDRQRGEATHTEGGRPERPEGSHTEGGFEGVWGGFNGGFVPNPWVRVFKVLLFTAIGVPDMGLESKHRITLYQLSTFPKATTLLI